MLSDVTMMSKWVRNFGHQSFSNINTLEWHCTKFHTLFTKWTIGPLNSSTIQGTSGDKISQELGLESRKSRRWQKRLVCLLKIMNEKAPNYLINLIHKYEPTIRIRNNSIQSYKCRTNCFKHHLFSF